MERINLRKLVAGELKQVRSQVVRLKKMGKTGKEIEEITGVRPNRISEIWTAYQREGESALAPKKRGRKKGTCMTLTKEESREIRKVIISKTPEQLKLNGFLWTLAKISEYIRDTYHKEVSVRSLTNYMKRWGLTCQRPTKRACGQDIARIEKFKREEYPAIAKRAKAENAEIYWGDETGVCNRENYERGFAEKGHPPVLPLPTKQERVNMLSAITNQGSVRFMVYEETMNQRLFIDFMSRLVKDAKRKVFFIVDNLKVHHGKLAAAWLEEHKDKIELFFLPPYAPESNPDEYLNHALKRNVHSGNLPRSKKEIRQKVHSYMRRLQRDKNKVSAFFRHKDVSYILLQG
jgi:transposase